MLWDVLWDRFGELFLDGVKFVPNSTDEKAVRTLPLKEAMYLLHKNYTIGKSGDELLETANSILLDFYSNDVKLKDGVGQFLDNCYEEGIKMCVASATAPFLIDAAVKHLGLEKYFSKIFSCALIGKGKDEPDIYLIAHDYLKTDLEETWVFEDSPVALATARGIGLNTVGVYDKYNPLQDEVKKNSTVYISQNQDLTELLK